MKNKLQYIFLLLTLIIIIPLTGCSSNKENPETQEKFDTFLNELFIENVQSDVITLHTTLVNPKKYGIEKAEELLGSISMKEAEEESVTYFKDLRKRLDSFKYSELSVSQKLTFDVLSEYIEKELKAENLIKFSQGFHPSGGIQSYLPVILAEYELREQKDIVEYLEIIEDIQRFYQEMIAFEKEKIELGTFMSDSLVDMLVKECEDFISKTQDNILITSFNTRIDQFDGLDQTQKDEYKLKNKNLVLDKVIPSYQNVIDEFTSMKGSGTNEGGLALYDKGKDYYEYLFSIRTGSRHSVKETIDLLDQAMVREILTLQSVLNKNPDVVDQYDTYSFNLQDPMLIMDHLKQATTNDFPSLKDINYSIKYVDDSLKESLAPAFFLTPPIDDFSNSVVYINEKNDRTLKTIFPTVAHEGYPGHLYQISYFYGSNTPEIRKMLSYKGYTEGWAVYTEEYSYQHSGLEEGLASLLNIDYHLNIFLMCRVDIGIHYEGWNKEDLQDYLISYLGELDDETIDNLYYTTIADPGNSLSYGIGYLEFISLKEKAEDKLGDKFNLKDFHTFLLDVGPTSFNIIEDEMNKWIKEVK